MLPGVRSSLTALLSAFALAALLAGCGSSTPADRASDAAAGYTFTLSGRTLTLARAAASPGERGESAQVGCEQDYAKLAAESDSAVSGSPDAASATLKLPGAGRSEVVRMSRALAHPDACELLGADFKAVAFFNAATRRAYARQVQLDTTANEDQVPETELQSAWSALTSYRSASVFASAARAREAVLTATQHLTIGVVKSSDQVKAVDQMYVVDDQKPGVVHFAERSESGRLFQFTADAQRVLRRW